MPTIVVGGHSRNVGKTSVVAGIISALREKNWLAIKITQYGHGICSADGGACDCVTDDHTMALMEEHDRSGKTDTSRFLVAGASRVLWARTRQGYLAELMPRLREQITRAENVIVESNSVMRFLQPDIYVSVLDPGVKDFKLSAKEFLDRADILIVQKTDKCQWEGVSDKLMGRGRVFVVSPPRYVTEEIVAEIRARLARVQRIKPRAEFVS